MEILNIIVTFIISICVILIPVGVAVGIIFLVVASSEKDVKKKKRNKSLAALSFFLPVILLFVTLTTWGFLAVIKGSFLK